MTEGQTTRTDHRDDPRQREPTVEYSRHVEPPAQGGEPYVRCEECGAELLESLGGKENLVHRDGCPAGEGR